MLGGGWIRDTVEPWFTGAAGTGMDWRPLASPIIGLAVLVWFWSIVCIVSAIGSGTPQKTQKTQKAEKSRQIYGQEPWLCERVGVDSRSRIRVRWSKTSRPRCPMRAASWSSVAGCIDPAADPSRWRPAAPRRRRERTTATGKWARPTGSWTAASARPSRRGAGSTCPVYPWIEIYQRTKKNKRIWCRPPVRYIIGSMQRPSFADPILHTVKYVTTSSFRHWQLHQSQSWKKNNNRAEWNTTSSLVARNSTITLQV